jgi:hypothetical protein
LLDTLGSVYDFITMDKKHHYFTDSKDYLPYKKLKKEMTSLMDLSKCNLQLNTNPKAAGESSAVNKEVVQVVHQIEHFIGISLRLYKSFQRVDETTQQWIMK